MTLHLYLQLHSPRNATSIQDYTPNDPTTKNPHLCVMKPGLQKLGVNQGNAAVYCPFPDLYVHVTKAAKLQLQQVLPRLCKCSLFLKESKGTELYSSQHNHHLLLLFLFSCLQYYQLTIHASTVNAKRTLTVEHQLIQPKQHRLELQDSKHPKILLKTFLSLFPKAPKDNDNL